MDVDRNMLVDLVAEPWVEDKEVEFEQAAIIEAWLDRLLLKILATASNEAVASGDAVLQGGLRRTGLDRKKLTEGGLEPAQVDALYRALYLHTMGMFRILKSIELEQEMEQKVMAAFKLLTSYLPKLEAEPSMSLGNDAPKTKLEVCYLQLRSKLEVEEDAWRAERQAFESRIYEEKLKCARKHEECVGLQHSIVELRSELERCKRDLNQARTANEALKAVMIRHEEELTKLHEDCPDDVKELIELRAENVHVRKQLAEAERQLRITKDQLEEAVFNAAELPTVKVANGKLKEKLISTGNELQDAREEIDSLKMTIEKLDNENYALNQLYHDESSRCAALRLQLRELEDGRDKPGETHAEQLSAERSSSVQADKADDLKNESDGFREDKKENEKLLKERISELENQTHAFKLSLMVLDDSMRNIVGGVCLEKQGLRELVESIRENGMKLIVMARKQQEAKAQLPSCEDESVCKDSIENQAATMKSTDEEEFQAFTLGLEEANLSKMETECQYIEEEVGIRSLMSWTELNELASSKSESEAPGDCKDTQQQKDAFDPEKLKAELETNFRHNLEEQALKTAEIIKSMERAYQEIVLSNQAFRAEIESVRITLQSATEDADQLKSQLQEEKAAHAEAMSSLWELGKERMHVMENHNNRVEELTVEFMSALEEEKAAHAKTQLCVAQLLEEKQQQLDVFKQQETAWRSEMAVQVQNHRSHISVMVREFQDTVRICLNGIESANNLFTSQDSGTLQKGTWKLSLEALNCSSETLFEPLKDIKLIAEERAADLLSAASKIIPSLHAQIEQSESRFQELQLTVKMLEERAAFCGPNLKHLATQLWKSCCSSGSFCKALHELSSEILKSASDFWRGFGSEVRRNECSVKYSKIIRGLEEVKSRLELQMDGSLVLERNLSELHQRLSGQQTELRTLSHNPFSSIDECNFFENLAVSLQTEEHAVKEKADLELEVSRLKAKLKSEQVSRIWRDKYIRDLVNKYNAQFNDASPLCKETQTLLSISDTGHGSYWKELVLKAKPLTEKATRQKIADIYASKIKHDVQCLSEAPAMADYLSIYFQESCESEVESAMLELLSSILHHQEIPDVRKFAELVGVIEKQQISQKETDAISTVSAEQLTHPLTSETTQSVLRIPGLSSFLVLLCSSEFGNNAKNFNMGVPLSKTTRLPQLSGLLEQACSILEMDLPNLYVRESPFCRAYSWCLPGSTSTLILNSKLFDILSPEELQAVMAQQLYLIKFPHVQQLATAWTVLSLAPELVADTYLASNKQHDAKRKPWFSFATNRPRHTHSVPGVIVNSLDRWMRFSALSSDRAALVVTRSLRVTVETNFKVAAGSSTLSSQINFDSFADASAELSELSEAISPQDDLCESSTLWDMESKHQQHHGSELELGKCMQSMPVLRAKEISSWASSMGLTACSL